MTGKMTEAEYRDRVKAIVGDAAPIGRVIDDLESLATEAGVEFAPKQVEPRVGDLLTEATRLVDLLGVVDADEVLWQYDEEVQLWHAAIGYRLSYETSRMVEARIVFIPGESNG